MAHRAERKRARSRSLRADGRADLVFERIRHARAESDAPQAARAFVLAQLQGLPNGCVLEIEFDFDPSGLLDDLAGRSAPAQSRKTSRCRWLLSLQPAGDRALIDLCDLEAPLPLERILEAAAELRPGHGLIARTPCFPNPLLAELDRRGLDWEAAESTDSSALVWVGRPS